MSYGANVRARLVAEHVTGCRQCWLDGWQDCQEAQRLIRAWHENADAAAKARIVARLQAAQEAAR